MPRPSEPTRETNSASAAWARYAGLGLQFAATVGVFAALGLWADARLGTGPWLVIVAVGIGFAGGFLALIRAVPPVRSKSDPRSSARSPQDPPQDP